MTEIVKIDGSPGAGKSHTLETRLEVEKDNGVGLYDFWWLNFTTSGRKDVEPTLKEMFPPDGENDGSDRAKTVHGLALTLLLVEGEIDLGDDGEDRIIMEQPGAGVEAFERFCDERSIPYNRNGAGTRSILSGEASEQATGNRLFAVNDYLRQTYKPPSCWRDAPVDMEIPGDAVKRLLDEWSRFKRNQQPRLWEHGDYLEAAIDANVVPDVDVLLIDEFQDLAPLEYKLYKQWRDDGRIDRIYISGDENQSVYSFRGGTPLYFEETNYDETITLKKSWRCPERVAHVGHEILASHSQTDPRGFSGKDGGGVVETTRYHSKDELRDAVVSACETDESPAVMLLVRTNRQLGKLANDLRETGVPFRTLGNNTGVWTADMARIYRLLSAWGETDTYHRRRLEALFTRLNGDSLYDREIESVGPRAYDASDVHVELNAYGGCMEIADALVFNNNSAWRVQVLKNALDSPADISPDDVRIGTIHAAKGLEAPTVLLFANTTRSMRRRYRRQAESAAEEHRLYYVGVTRASSRLTLVEDYFGGPLAPPIERAKVRGAV